MTRQDRCRCKARRAGRQTSAQPGRAGKSEEDPSAGGAALNRSSAPAVSSSAPDFLLHHRQTRKGPIPYNKSYRQATASHATASWPAVAGSFGLPRERRIVSPLSGTSPDPCPKITNTCHQCPSRALNPSCHQETRANKSVLNLQTNRGTRLIVHRAGVRVKLVDQEAVGLCKLNISRDQIQTRLWLPLSPNRRFSPRRR